MTLSDFPNELPALTLDFLNSRQLDPRINFSRASDATPPVPSPGTGNHNGGVYLYPGNVPRLTDQGLLIEEERTNFITNSIDFSDDNGDWSDGGFSGTASEVPTLTPAPASVTAPDGTNTATRMQAATGGGITGSDYSQIGCQRTSNANAAVSVWMKSNTNANQNVWMSGAGGTAVVTPQWQRFTGTSTQWRIGARGDFSDANIDILIWGAQVEEGANPGGFSTSYIPTSGGTVTRARDICLINGINLSGWYDNNQGTFVLHVPYLYSQSNNNNRTFFISTDGGNTMLGSNIFSNNFRDIRANSLNAEVSTVATLPIDNSLNEANLKIAWAYASGDPQLAVNIPNTEFVESSSSSETTYPTLLQIGEDPRSTTNVNCLNGYLSRISYYTTRLSDDALEALTT